MVVVEGWKEDRVLGPREKVTYTLPYDYSLLAPESEYFVKVQFLLAQDMPWAKKGFVQMEEQLPVKAAGEKPALASVTASMERPSVEEAEDFTTVSGNGFTLKFDNHEGTIYSMEYNGRKVILDGKGPKLDALRAPVDNDNWARGQWFEKGLHNLKHKVLNYAWVNAKQKGDNTVQLMYTVESQAPNAAVLEGGNSGRNSIIGRAPVEHHVERPVAGAGPSGLCDGTSRRTPAIHMVWPWSVEQL